MRSIKETLQNVDKMREEADRAEEQRLDMEEKKEKEEKTREVQELAEKKEEEKALAKDDTTTKKKTKRKLETDNDGEVESLTAGINSQGENENNTSSPLLPEKSGQEKV